MVSIIWPEVGYSTLDSDQKQVKPMNLTKESDFILLFRFMTSMLRIYLLGFSFQFLNIIQE